MKKFLSMVLVLVMTMSLVTISAGAKSFTDDSKITYKEAVDVVSEIGIVDGYEDGAFNPTNTLTRGAAAKIICNLILGPTTASALSADTAPYSDVPTNNTFAGYIAYCAQQGIISGYADGTFRPAATLTGYAFMKMLLGALGYDASIEGFVGANWSVQVGKTALGIDLDNGYEGDFVGTKAVTREEACLFAFNTLKATMVEYENQSSIVIGDITVNTSSKAKEMENTGRSDGNIDENKRMEFAEKYFTDLKLRGGQDAFSRPANVWSLKSVEIGTYAKTPDASYTAKVENGDVYKDLGLGSTMDKADVTVYVNGEEQESYSLPLRKSGDTKIGESANGVLTEVFYDKDDGSAVITQVKTYVGEISKTVKATDKKDAYVEVVTTVTSSGIKPDTAAGTEKFETNEEFDDEAYVLYTFSIPEDEIQSVALAETATGTVTKVVNKPTDMNNSKLTMDGTEYKASATMAPSLLDSASVDNDYTIYLDAYGYVITVDEEDYSNYALVLDIEGYTSTDLGKTNRALLVLTDGTIKTVNTAADYTKKTGVDKVVDNTIVTYKENSDGEYVLKPVRTNKVAATKSVTDSTEFYLKNEVAKIEVTKTSSDPDDVFVYGNSKTSFVLHNVKDDDFTAYTGVKNAPSVDATASVKVNAYWYCKGTSNIASVMFIFPEADSIVTDENNNLLFLAAESASDLIHDSDGDYYEYQGIVNGEVRKDIKVDSGVSVGGMTADELNGLFSKYTTDTKTGIITGVTQYTTDSTKDKFAGAGVGTDRNSADYTVTVKNVSDGVVTAVNADTWTVADDAKFYQVDKKGNVSTGAYSSVSKDDDDRAYFIIDNGTVTHMFVEEVDAKDQAQPAKTVTIETTPDPATVTVGGTVTLTVTDVELFDAKNDKVTGYQWYKGGVASGNKLAGKTGKTLTLSNAQAADADTYYCEITTTNNKVDGKDTATKMSAGVAVTVNPAPAATMNVTINRYNVNGNVLLGTETVKLDATQVGSIAAPVVSDYTVAGKSTDSVSFVENGSASVSFYYAANALSIAVTTPPDKTSYVAGTSFETTGMKVTATYADGKKAEVTGFTVKDGTALPYGKTSVTVAYENEAGVELTTTTPITVTARASTLTDPGNKTQNASETQNYTLTATNVKDLTASVVYTSGGTADAGCDNISVSISGNDVVVTTTGAGSACIYTVTVTANNVDDGSAVTPVTFTVTIN